MKNKILMVSPPEQHFLMDAGDRPPLGLLYLKSYLKEQGLDSQISDLNHDSYFTFWQKLQEFRPTHIGLSFTSNHYDWAVNFSKMIKERTGLKLVAGGSHASADPKSIDDCFDHIVIGEGEIALSQLMLGNINDKLIQGKRIDNLDDIPFPARDSSPFMRYKLNMDGKRTATIMSTRACPYSCPYCAKQVSGSKYRKSSPGRVAEEVSQIVDKFGIKNFYFLNDTFTLDKPYSLETLEAINKKSKGLTFRIISRVDRIDEDYVKELKKQGVYYLSFGLEHADNDVLKRIHKETTVEQNANAIETANKHGILTRGSFILNLPGATLGTITNTLDFAKKHRLHHADFYLLCAYPGTRIWDKPEEYNCEITNREYSFYQTSGRTNVKTENLSVEESQQIRKKIVKEWEDFKNGS